MSTVGGIYVMCGGDKDCEVLPKLEFCFGLAFFLICLCVTEVNSVVFSAEEPGGAESVRGMSTSTEGVS